MESLLKKIYYSTDAGFKSLVPLFELAHAKDENITKAQVKAFLEKQEGYQLTRKSTTNKNSYHHIIGPLGSWQFDLMFYDQYATINSNHGVFLVAIEINTRFLMVVPLKNKDQYEVLRGFSEIYMHAPEAITPVNILSDNGTEFKNATLQEIENELTINHFYAEPEDHRKLGMIDRVIRTLRTLIERFMASYDTHRFIDELPKLVENYNSSPSSATGMSPSDALKHLDEIVELQIAKRDGFNPGRVLEVGDEVRVLKKRTVFDKGTTQTFSKSVHFIMTIQGTRYKLDNGKSYAYDSLQKVDGEDVQQAPEKAKEHVRKEEEVTISKEKQTKALERESIREANIVHEPRVRRAPVRFQ